MTISLTRRLHCPSPARHRATQVGGSKCGGRRSTRISHRFKELAAEARLPVIRFHAARHIAATPALRAKVDTKIVSEQLSHSTTRITEDLYQHVSVQMQIGAAETVVALLPERKERKTKA